MILEKEQIQRYMRHIIMPEISGPGQKKLLDSSLVIFGQNVPDVSAAVYYAAASGMGHIYCRFDDASGYEDLFDSVHDLNPGITLKCFTDSDSDAMQASENVFRIVIGNMNFIRKCLNGFKTLGVPFIPTAAAITDSWNGILCTYLNNEDLYSLNEAIIQSEACTGSTGFKLSTSFAGVLAIIESIKYCVGIGKPAVDGLYFDLYEAVYENIKAGCMNKYIDMLSQSKSEFDNEQTASALSQAKVLVVGSGGLGSPIAYALVSAGVGTIGLMDYDRVELSNLNRQIMHSTGRLGMPKVESAKAFLGKVNPNVNIITYNTAFNKDNAIDTISGYDVAADGLDNLPTRYLLNDACYFAKKPFVEAGVLSFFGLATVVIPDSGPCYRCFFPETKGNSAIPSCAEAGVLGPVPGVLGFIQAAEVIKLLIGKGTTLQGKILSYDALEQELCTTAFDKSAKCAICGTNPTIASLVDYEFVCDTKQNLL